MSGVQGGKFWTGFASGSLSSLVSSLWSGGDNIKDNGDFTMSRTVWNGLGGKFSQSTTGIIAFGTIAGGAGAALAKGNFWQGAVTGLVVSGLNHAAHRIASKNSTFTREQIKQIRDNYPEPNLVSLDELIEMVGGEFAKLAAHDKEFYDNLKGNTCATRLSYAMNKSGFKVSGKGTYNGQNMKVFISADLMTKNYLIPNFTRVNVWNDSIYDYPQRTKNGVFQQTTIISQFDLSTGMYKHVDVLYNGNPGTNIYKSSYNLNFYGL